jgi:hypothetical protein
MVNKTLMKHKNVNDTNQLLFHRVDLKFIIFHRPTKTEIQMPVLSICEEYSSLLFSASEKDYNGEYNGIGRLPSYSGNDTADDYDVYVEINGIKYLYDGVFYSNYRELRRNLE